MNVCVQRVHRGDECSFCEKTRWGWATALARPGFRLIICSQCFDDVVARCLSGRLPGSTLPCDCGRGERQVWMTPPHWQILMGICNPCLENLAGQFAAAKLQMVAAA